MDLEHALNTSYSNLADADEAIDQLNNKIGRELSANLEEADWDMRTMSLVVLEEFHENGLYTAEYDSKTESYSIVKTTITDEQYINGARAMLKMDENGHTDENTGN